MLIGQVISRRNYQAYRFGLINYQLGYYYRRYSTDEQTAMDEVFELYKQTPQFQKINSDFTLKQFKFIYFWEYLHRLWVRTLGIIFLIPFIIFVIRKQIDFFLIKRLSLVVF